MFKYVELLEERLRVRFADAKRTACGRFARKSNSNNNPRLAISFLQTYANKVISSGCWKCGHCRICSASWPRIDAALKFWHNRDWLNENWRLSLIAICPNRLIASVWKQLWLRLVIFQAGTLVDLINFKIIYFSCKHFRHCFVSTWSSYHSFDSSWWMSHIECPRNGLFRSMANWTIGDR